MQYSRGLLVAERPRVCTEMSFEAVGYYHLAQNLEAVQFLISKKDLDNSFFFLFSFVGIVDD